MMQNLPLLNTPNVAPKANAQSASKSNNMIEQADEGGSFQQKLMHQIYQKSNNQQTAQSQQAAHKNESAESKAVMEKDTPASDFIGRKIKSLIGKATQPENNRPDLAQSDKATPDATATNVEEAGHLVDGTLIPVSLNVLAQIQQAAPKESGGLSSDPALNATQPKTDDLVSKLAVTDGNEALITADTSDGTTPTQTGVDKSLLEKSSLDKLALTAGNQRAQSEDFASAMSDSLNKTTAIKEPVASIMQNQVMPAAQTAAANLAGNSQIMAHPGKEGWNQAIGQRVMWMVGAAQQSATLTLNPPEMGPLQIVINVHNDKADTTFFSDRQEVRQALQDGMDNLREMMKEAGINLGQTNINQRDKSAQHFMQQQQARMQNSSNTGEAIQESSISTDPARVGLGLVDTFA